MEEYEDRQEDLYPLVIDDGPVDLGVETSVANLAEEHVVGMKHPLEEMEDDFDAKRFKTEDGKKAAQQSTNRQWDAMFERLEVFKQKYGHCLVPKRYAEDPKLGTWVETQRVQYKRLQREYDEASGVEAVQPNKRLNQERLRKLQEIGFVWSAKHVKKQRNNSLPSLLSPMETDMPIVITAQGPPPSRPRKTETKAARLNDEQWEEMYQRLVRYKEEHGECLVPRKYEADPKLSSWVETQRLLWNRDYRHAAFLPTDMADQDRNVDSSTDSLPLMPDPAHVPLTAGMSSEWTADMGEDADVVAAAAAAAAEAVDEEVDRGVEASPPQLKLLTKERKEKLDALGFVWSLRNKRIDDHWDEMFRQLVVYKETHGDCLVPSRYEVNLKLGKWVETQRYEYTKLKRAEATSSDPNAKMAETKMDKFQEDMKPIADAGGNSKPRVTNARLTEERLRRLEFIGFEWKVRNKMKRYYDKQWQEMFDQLLQFKIVNGHTMVPKRYPDNPRLANWVHTQRIQYRKLMAGARKDPFKDSESKEVLPTGYMQEVLPANDAMEELPANDMKEVLPVNDMKLSKEDEISFRLTEQRRQKLEEIGFVWSVRESDAKTDQNRMTRNSYDDLWDKMYERLKVYKDRYGNCLVPKRSQDDPKLGTWVDTQRVQYKKMKKKLADQGVPYDEQRVSAEERQEAVGKQQNKPVIGRLTEDRIRRLNDLGFVWSLRDDWTKHYDELKDFRLEHGHCNVPARYAKNRRLGIWVSAQRQQYKQLQQVASTLPPGTRIPSPLTPERIDLLNQLGFTWTIRSRDSLGESWNQRFQELCEYKTIHGTCLVPSRYQPNPELGIWVGTQRTQYRLFIKAKESGQKMPGSAGMNEERIKQLEGMGFVWALRTQEGIHKDGSVLEDTENLSNSVVVQGEPIHVHSPGMQEDMLHDASVLQQDVQMV